MVRRFDIYLQHSNTPVLQFSMNTETKDFKEATPSLLIEYHFLNNLLSKPTEMPILFSVMVDLFLLDRDAAILYV